MKEWNGEEPAAAESILRHDMQMRMQHDMQMRMEMVLARIAAAARRVGRDPEEVTLVAVSKTVGIPQMEAALACGLHHFGENRVQEFLHKQAAIAHKQSAISADWHFIGRLQTNKVRQLAGKPLLLHSLDRMALLEEMCRQTERTGFRWQALIEVNVSGEPTKAGVLPDQLEQMVRAVSTSGCVDLLGLMTVAPDREDPEAVRPYFRRLREFFVDIRSWKLDNVVMEHLSMGMSHDVDVAVEEGATVVRVGTALFGSRRQNPSSEPGISGQ